jgi:hypothetical protein
MPCKVWVTGGRERVSDARVKPPWTINIHYWKKGGQEGKTGLLQWWVLRGAEHKEKVKEGEHGGYILQTEEWNLLKMF